QHLAVVRVAPVLGNTEEVAEFATRVGMRICQCPDRDRPVRNAKPCPRVHARDGAAGDDRRSVCGHQSTLSGRVTVCPVAFERYAAWTISTARLPSSPVWRVGTS